MPRRGDYSDRKEDAAGEFDRILKEHHAAIARVAASYTRTAVDRDDLYQEITIALWRALPRFRGECAEKTFVFRVAHNRAVSYLARRRVFEPMTEDAMDQAPDPETELVRERRSEALLEAVRRLPLPHRQVTMLVLEGLDYADVADVLGISESNVGARLTRAREMLRPMLEKHR
jgi:RNA polymerase sigma-70 factor (ECF subfamily)